MYSIGEFAKLVNRSVRTLQRWDREGTLVACRNPKQRRYYTEQHLLEYKGLLSTECSLTIAYCRVSTRNQADDLKNQKSYINQFCQNGGIGIDDWYEDIGSGLNFKRKRFNHLMMQVETGKIKRIILAHKDRLVRFGFDWFAQFCQNHGCEITVIHNDALSPEQELVQDLIAITHVFSSRLYGLRTYKKTIKEAIHADLSAQNSTDADA